MNIPLCSISNDGLLTMRTVYLLDIEFIKTSKYKCNDENFICKYLLHLEQQVEYINEELLERGFYKDD